MLKQITQCTFGHGSAGYEELLLRFVLGRGISAYRPVVAPQLVASDSVLRLPYLFHRFYRADAARSDAARNHGLGLAIVAAIARMHGGRIMAESNGGVTSIGLTVPDPFKPSAPHPEAATR